MFIHKHDLWYCNNPSLILSVNLSVFRVIIYFTPCIKSSPMKHFRRYQNIYFSLHRALLLVSLLKSGARCRSLNKPLQLSSNSEPAIVVIVALWIVCPKSRPSYCQSIMYDVVCIMYTSLQYLLHTAL